MSVIIEFQFSPADSEATIRSSKKYIRQQSKPPANLTTTSRPARRLFPWILYVLIVLMMMYLVGRSPRATQPSSTPDAGDNEGWLAHGISDFIPWILVLAFICYVGGAFLVAWIRARRLTSGPTDPPDQLYRMTADESGLVWTGSATPIEYSWQTFCDFIDSDGLFLLYTRTAQKPVTIQVLTVPKRAFGSSAMLEEFSGLLRKNIREHTLR